MEIGNFKKGDKVYVLYRHYGEPELKEEYVVSVGRKYVKVAVNPDAEWGITAYKQTDYNCTGKNVLPYLEEAEWNGNNRNLLFKDETTVREYHERKELKKWFHEFKTDFNAFEKLTNEQVKAIRTIVENK
ncbi:MAG: hypothetical protein IKI37_00725 [Oscillospiraceae bacterium]|nr:hypothetical protein [Oscillospiraceae bacterium]